MALHSIYERIPLSSGAYTPQASTRLDQTEKHCPETQQSHVFAAEGRGKKKTAGHEHHRGVTRYQQSEGIKGQRSGDASQRWLEVARKVIFGRR